MALRVVEGDSRRGEKRKEKARERAMYVCTATESESDAAKSADVGAPLPDLEPHWRRSSAAIEAFGQLP